jgi:nucleoside-diphosphate-sugar epimerase
MTVKDNFKSPLGFTTCEAELSGSARESPAPPDTGLAPAGSGSILVLGGAGYVGSILVRRLLEAGKSVRVLDSLLYGGESVRDLIAHPRFELVVGDCRNIQSVVSAMRGAGALIHLAGIVGDPACEQDPDAALEINYAATRMLIDAAKRRGISRFIFASSCSVYGATEYLAAENCELRPVSLYARTKADSEQALQDAASASFGPVILRFGTVFGLSWRPRFDLVVNRLAAQACQESRITIHNGEQWRPFLHVRDVSEAILAVLNAPMRQAAAQIYNVGDSRMNYTLRQVAEKVLEHFPGTRAEYIETADKRNYRVAFEKIRRDLGFRCIVSLDEGIAEIRRAFESGMISDYNNVRHHNQRFLKESGTLAIEKALDRHIGAPRAEKPECREPPAPARFTG